MRKLHSTPFLFSLVFLLCLPLLPRLIDASALHFPHELLSDEIAPNMNVSYISKV